MASFRFAPPRIKVFDGLKQFAGVQLVRVNLFAQPRHGFFENIRRGQAGLQRMFFQRGVSESFPLFPAVFFPFQKTPLGADTYPTPLRLAASRDGKGQQALVFRPVKARAAWPASGVFCGIFHVHARTLPRFAAEVNETGKTARFLRRYWTLATGLLTQPPKKTAVNDLYGVIVTRPE